MDKTFKEELQGDFVLLRKVTLDDAGDIYKWRTSESGKFMRHPENYSVLSQMEWIKARSGNEINYIIVSKETNEKVGMVAIYDASFQDGVANVGRLLLAEEYLKKSTPYGLEALLLTYDYLFNGLQFRKMTGDILAKNTEMVKLQKFLGMHEEGYLKEHTVIHGVAEDIHLMSIFKEKFPGYANKIRFLLKSFKK